MTMILGKAALGLGLGLLAALFLLLRPWQRFPESTTRRWLWGAMVFSRLALYVGIYLFLDQRPRADVSAYYLPQGRAILAGEAVYRDFPSSYGPLFPYVTAVTLFFDGSGRAFVLLSVLIDLAAYYLWGGALRRTELSEQQIQMGEVLYILSPLAVMESGLGGSRPWVAALVAGAAVLALRRRSFASGVTLGLGFVLTRILTGLYVPGVARMVDRPHWVRLLAGISIPVGVAAVALWSLQANPFHSLGEEAGKISGGNLPFLFHFFTGSALPQWIPLGLLGAALVYIALRRQEWGSGNPLIPIAISQVAFMLLSPKSFAGYFVFAALPVLALIRWSPRSLVGLAAWHTAMAAEASCHFRWFGGRPVQLDLSDSRTLLLLVAELIIVGGYLWMLRCLVSVGINNSDVVQAPAPVPSAPSSM